MKTNPISRNECIFLVRLYAILLHGNSIESTSIQAELGAIHYITTLLLIIHSSVYLTNYTRSVRTNIKYRYLLITVIYIRLIFFRLIFQILKYKNKIFLTRNIAESI